jgi:hypothetical protein
MHTLRTDAPNLSRARTARRFAFAIAFLAIPIITTAITARPGAASELDLGQNATIMKADQPVATIMAVGTGAAAMNALFGSSASGEYRPIRHRRPGGYSDGYGYRPEYFATLGVGSFGPSSQEGSGVYVNGAVGSTFAHQLDLGLQLSWYHRSSGGSELVRTYTDPAGITRRDVIQTGSTDTDLVPIMGTLRVRFPVSGGVQPYVGGAIGWEWLTVQGADLAGNDFRDDYDGFGAQILGGANFDLTPDVGLYGEAVWNLSTVSADFFDPILAATVHEEVDFNGVGAHAGLRFRF